MENGPFKAQSSAVLTGMKKAGEEEGGISAPELAN
jgi:hypothetical protein